MFIIIIIIIIIIVIRGRRIGSPSLGESGAWEVRRYALSQGISYYSIV